MDIYAFGSFCRGEIDDYSDIDLLIVTSNRKDHKKFDKNKYSIYSADRIEELWKEGNPFAWHLFLESKLIYSPKDDDIIKSLGRPKNYAKVKDDLMKFYKLFLESKQSFCSSTNSQIFDLSMIFLAIRNFASCYSIGCLGEFNFSRNSAKSLSKNSLKISDPCYEILEKARIISTRGIDKSILQDDVSLVFSELKKIEQWFENTMTQINYG